MVKENTNTETLQQRKPDAALRRLDILVGRWELKGRRRNYYVRSK